MDIDRNYLDHITLFTCFAFMPSTGKTLPKEGVSFYSNKPIHETPPKNINHDFFKKIIMVP